MEEQYGIEIVVVDVKKLDLPDDNKQAVYARMISERENIAAPLSLNQFCRSVLHLTV